MHPLLENAPAVALVGIGATLFMDLGLAIQKRLGLPVLNMALLGRWVGHIARGRWFHPAIAQSRPIPGESLLGWLVHYLVGMVFAGALVAFAGPDWLRQPDSLAALGLGLVSLAAPLLVMQPAMGAGIASRRTATPWKNRLRSLGNHLVYGLGLYLSGLALAASQA